MGDQRTQSGYGMLKSGMIVPWDHPDAVRVASPDADIVLDPTCGSGTAAEAASMVCRRFICIDREHAAIEKTRLRLPSYVRRRTSLIEWFHDWRVFAADPMIWDCGSNFLVRGDSLEVLRSMPDSFVALVYCDPPFNANRQFRNKDGEGFSDIWRWDDDAESRLRECEDIDVTTDRWINGATVTDREKAKRSACLLVEQCLLMNSPDRASYLSWMILLMTECRRVSGSYEWSDS